MTQSITLSNPNYTLPYVDFMIQESTLRLTRYGLGAVLIISSGVGISNLCHYYLPSWASNLDIGAICSSVLLLGGSFIFKPHLPLTDYDTPCLTPQQLSSESEKLVHQLCCMDLEGREIECTLNDVEIILDELKQKDALLTLNTVPSYYLRSKELSLFALPVSKYTPLQHWASQGNVEIVKLLIENGARDYCTGSPTETTSALFEAALGGHIETVKILLRYGARADFAFNGNVLHFFIPKLIFEISQQIESDIASEKCLYCLQLVLNSLSEKPTNLAFQLQIPVNDGRVNALKLIHQKEENPIAQAVAKVLIEFGADESNVFSIKELKGNNLNVASGTTLCERSALKHV